MKVMQQRLLAMKMQKRKEGGGHNLRAEETEGRGAWHWHSAGPGPDLGPDHGKKSGPVDASFHHLTRVIHLSLMRKLSRVPRSSILHASLA